jgi:copper chaperone NosL
VIARVALAAAALAVLAACATGPVQPAPLDTRNDACAWCRMAVSDARFAAQLVAPGEEPRFFDDIGCLADYLRASPAVRPGSAAYVADHRSKAWVSAAAATFVRCPGLATPMASGLAAFADAASRDGDPEARRCAAVSVGDVFGAPPPAGEAR